VYNALCYTYFWGFRGSVTSDKHNAHFKVKQVQSICHLSSLGRFSGLNKDNNPTMSYGPLKSRRNVWSCRLELLSSINDIVQEVLCKEFHECLSVTVDNLFLSN